MAILEAYGATEWPRDSARPCVTEAPTGWLTSHLVSHPEITVTGDAAGSWALQDVVHEEDGVAIRGASYYDDRYVRTRDATRSPTQYSRPKRAFGKDTCTRSRLAWHGRCCAVNC